MGSDTTHGRRPTGRTGRRRILRGVAIAAGVVLAVVVLLGSVGFLLLWEASRCHSTDPEGLRLLQSLEIEDVRPAHGELVYGPMDPSCSTLFGGPSQLEPERSWGFDFPTRSSAAEGLAELVAAAERDGWRRTETDDSTAVVLIRTVDGRDLQLEIWGDLGIWNEFVRDWYPHDPDEGWRVSVDTTVAEWPG